MQATAMRCKKFALQKDGNPVSVYEDAWDLHEDKTSGLLRCAVADGATESFCSGYWARILAAAYCRGEFENGNFNGSLAEIQDLWNEHVSRKELPWYAEEKARSGAFAALVGLTVDTSAKEGDCRIWQAIALGDSCLFHYRDGKLINSMPIANVVEFGNNPYLISSRQENNIALPEHVVKVEGIWEPGDQFLLMSDAISCWLMQRELEAAAPLAELEQMTDELFVPWVDAHRKMRQENGRPVMKNDDVTLVHLVLAEEET